MNEREEEAYTRGRESAYRSLLGDILRELRGNDSLEAMCGRLQAERMDTMNALREAFEDIGSQYFNDQMHMADIVRTLMRSLPSTLEQGETQ